MKAGTADYRRRLLAQLEADPDDPRHGSRIGYDAGHRCAQCAEAGLAARVRAKQLLLEQLLADPEDHRHRSPRARTAGCPCTRCGPRSRGVERR